MILLYITNLSHSVYLKLTRIQTKIQIVKYPTILTVTKPNLIKPYKIDFLPLCHASPSNYCLAYKLPYVIKIVQHCLRCILVYSLINPN